MGIDEHNNRYASHTFNEMGHKSGIGFLKKSKNFYEREIKNNLIDVIHRPSQKEIVTPMH